MEYDIDYVYSQVLFSEYFSESAKKEPRALSKASLAIDHSLVYGCLLLSDTSGKI